MNFVALTSVTLFSAVLGGTWTQTHESLAFLLDCGINDASAAYYAALANGVGQMWMKSNDLGANLTVLEERDGFFDLAASTITAETAAVSGLLGKALYTLDGGKSIRTSVGLDAGSQSMSRCRNCDIYGCAAGDGLHISTSYGATWEHFKALSLNASRYCAIPSASTFYISAGIWDEYTTFGPEEYTDYIKVNSRVTILYDKHTKKMNTRIRGINHHPNAISNKINNNNRRKLQQTSMWGAIYKSTDGGSTWSEIFANDGQFYFNAIDCCDDKTCYAVGEGDEESGSNNPGARIYKTTDGMQWDLVYFDQNDAASLMTVRCISDMEAYAGGGNIEGGRGNFYGFFLHTTNGGGNWTVEDVKAPVMWMDMSDDGTVGVATGLTKDSTGIAYGFH